MFLLSVAGCQGIQKYTLALGSLAIFLGKNYKLKVRDSPSLRTQLAKPKKRKSGSVGCGLVKDGMQEQPPKCLHQA